MMPRLPAGRSSVNASHFKKHRNKRGISRGSRARRAQFLALETLECRNLLAQLTVITHGRMDQIFDTPDVAPEWAFDMASAINARDGLGYSQTQINNSVVRYDATSNAAPSGGAADFLIFNWAEISDVDSPGRADDDEVAGKLASLVRARFPADNSPLDLHFIGHSRGSIVTLATINRLNNAADNAHIGTLTMTTLDPQDYGIPGVNTEDVSLKKPPNVDYAENYYQYVFPLGGGKIDGANVNENLSVRLALWDGRSVTVGSEHLEVVDRYYWSIDTNDAQAASYLRDDDLVAQEQEFMAENTANDRQLRALLFGPDPLDQALQLLKDTAQDFAQGVGQYFQSVSTELTAAFDRMEVPVIGDQLAQAVAPMTTALKSFGADAQDVLEDIIDFAAAGNGIHLIEAVQGGIYMLLGPGIEGLDKLTPEARQVLEPIATAIDAIHLGLLIDGPDLGDDISPSDIVITFGNDIGSFDNVTDPFWAQVDFRLGQFMTVDLPKFDLGLGSLTEFISDSADAEKMQTFLNDFGFAITSDTGLRANLRWDLRFGAGVSALPSQRFYLNSAATTSGLDTGDPIEELRASITVFAVPPNESETFAEAIFDETTTENLRTNISLGLMQAEVTDGTPTVVKITAAEGLDIQVIDLLQNFSGEFDIVVNESETIHIDYDPPGEETLPTFLLGLNAKLIEHYNTPIPPLSFTLDFGSIHRAANPDVPTTPSLVLVAHDSDIHHLSIVGAEEYKFLAVQHEDHRSKTLGFGNNTASTAAGTTQRLTASYDAPADGVTLEKPEFVLWIGGQRELQNGVMVTTGATPVVVAESLDADVSTLSGLAASLALLNEVDGLEGLRSAAEGLIQNLVGTTSSFDPETVTVELQNEKLVLVSHAAGGLTTAPLLTITYHSVEPTKLTLVAGIDVTDPNYNELIEDENDQRTYNRLTKAEISANDFFDVFVPVLKGEAQVRLHVDTNADHITGFLEQNLGLGEGAISLPEIGFDFRLDAAIDFTTLFAGDPEADDIFVIDTLQFDNVTLDVSQLLQSIVVPLAQAAVGVVEPVLDVIGHSADDVDALLNKRLPVISDIVGEDITVKDVLAGLDIDDDIEALIDTLQEADELGTTVSNFVNSQEFRDAVGASGDFSLGGWELVMNPDSPLYFPRTEVPVPIDFAYAIGSASEIGLESFTHVFTAFDTYTPAGFKIDLFGPKTILNMAIGKPFNIVSYGLPKIDADAEASFGFEFQDLTVDIAGDASFNSNLRLVYDSYGLAQIVSAFRSGAKPDWTDLIDGFAIQNDPDGYELGGHVGFAGSGQIGPILGTNIDGSTYVAFEAAASIDLYAELGLELVDPNNDGKFRLDEIAELTDNFSEPQNLFCMFDIQAAFSVNVSGSATVLGVDLGSGEMGLSTGDFSLQDLLSSSFGICTDDRTPILAEEIIEDGQTVLRLNTGPFATARLNGDTSDNTPDPFTHIIESNGGAILINESGEQLVFTAPDASGVYGSPEDDDTTLKKVNGLFEREFRGGTVHKFNSNNAIREIDNGLSTGVTYEYDSQGRLQKINHSDGTVSNYYPDIRLTVTTGSGGVLISGYGVTDQVYVGTFAKIVATGSGYNDTFDLSGVVGIPVEVDGRGGNDILKGGAAGDILVGGAGDDTLQGNAGNDMLFAGGGSNTVTDGLGDDTVDLSDNAIGFVLITGGGHDTVYGSPFADTISAPTGSTDNFHFVGGAGNDILTTGSGNDVLVGDDGDDQLTADAGNDTLTGGFGNDLLDGGAGNDTLSGEQGNDTLNGGAGTDSLSAGQGDDLLTSGLRDTLADAGSGDDHLIFRVDEFAHSGTLTNFSYDEAGQAAISYLNAESLEVQFGNGSGASFQTTNNYVLNISGPTLPLTQVVGGTGSDLVTVSNLPASAVQTIISLGGGDDRVTILDTQRALDIRGGDDGSNGDELIIERSTDIVSRAGALNATQIIGLGLSTINYDSFSKLTIRLGLGFDQFTIQNTAATTDTTLEGGGGDDTVKIQHVGGETIVNGNAGFDTATVLIPGNPNQVALADYAQLTFSIETLEVDNRENTTTSTNWIYNSGKIYVGVAPTAVQILDTLGAGKTTFLGGGAIADTLTVQDDVNLPQTIAINANSVEIQEGANVLSFQQSLSFTGYTYTATVDGLDGVEDTVFSPDGLYVYAIAKVDKSVTVFRRTSNNRLDFVQIMKDGQFGVDGLDLPTDIVISPDAAGRFVYISSLDDHSVATFERIPETGRLVYRGKFVDPDNQEIYNLAISPTTANLYVATKDSLLRLVRDTQTGLLTLGQKVDYGLFEPNGLAVGTDGADVFASSSTGMRQWHLTSGGNLPTAITSSTLTRAYYDLSTAANHQVSAVFDGGVATFNYGATLGSPTNTAHVNSTNKALGTAIAVDADDENRIVASFDKTSVDPSATTYTLRLLSIYAEGAGQDLTEGNIFTPGWELYAKVNGSRRGSIFEDFASDGTTKSLNININVTSAVTLELWEDDGSSGDDLLVSTTISVPFSPGNYSSYMEINVRDSGVIEGYAKLSFQVITNTTSTPTTQPIAIFDRNGSALDPDPALVTSGTVNKFESLTVSGTSGDFVGTNSGSDLLSLFGDSTTGASQLLTTVRDGALQTDIVIPAQPGNDDVQTVVSYDGRHAYAISAKYGTIAVYSRNTTTGQLGSLVQVIPAGLLAGASIAVPPPITRNAAAARDFVYITNPAEDSLLVYERNNTLGSATFGRLTLVQVLTDGLGGIDGLAGAGRIVISEDFTPRVYVAGQDENAIAVFSMNETDGHLTFVEAFRHADLQNPSSLALITTPSMIGIFLDPFLYVTNADNNGVVVLSRGGSLSHVQTIANGTGGVTAITQPSAIAISHDPLQLYVYVASPVDNTISVFEREVITGALTLKRVIREGVDGVSGIAGVTSLAINLESTHLIATSGTDTLAIFQIQSDQLTIVQRVRDGANLVQGIDHPQSVIFFINDVYVSSGGPEIGSGGIAYFDFDRFQAPGNHYLVEYSGMEALTVQSANQADLVNAGEITIPFTLNTLGSADTVNLRNTPAGTTTNVSLGDGSDILSLLTTGAGSTTTIHGNDGDDSFSIFATAANASTSISGDLGSDTFEVKGGRLLSSISVTGSDPAAPTLPGDTLMFDAQTFAATPVSPPLPAGFVRVNDPSRTFGVNYTTLETIIVISSPLANAGGPYTIGEGQSLTLSGVGSQAPAGHSNVSYRWSIGTSQGIADTVSPTITWAELQAAGVVDDGLYQVALTVTSDLNGITYSDTATTPLTITNVAPTLSITGSNKVEANQPYQISLSGTDPGADAIDVWQINWGDGSPVETVYGQPANAIHNYTTTGTKLISIVARDEDGQYAPITKSVSVTTGRFIRGNATVNEGQTYTLTLANPSQAVISSWTIHWGDGTVSTVSGGATAATHAYADEGSYQILATTATGNQLSAVPGTVQVSVRNVAPVIQSAAVTSPVNQGAATQFVIAATDAGTRDKLTYDFDFDDNGQFEFESATGSLNRVFAQVGSFPIAIRVRDEDGGLSSVSQITVQVRNVAPTIQRVEVGSALEGFLVRLEVSASDPGGDSDPLMYEFDFDNDGTYEVSSSATAASHVFPDNGTYPVRVRVLDQNNGQATSTVNVAVANVAPYFTRGSAAGRILEGATAVLTVSGSDIAGEFDPLTYAFDFDNDGTYDVTNNTTGSVTHTFVDDSAQEPKGVFVVPVRITDGDGGETFTTIELNVQNVAPTITLSGATIATEGELYTLNLGLVTDPGSDTVQRYVVHWGDGTEDTYTTAGPVTHVFNQYFGEHTIYVQLVDEDGTHPSAGEFRVVVVGYDFGDAPATYGTTGANAARHFAGINGPGPILGSSRDNERIGQPSAGADGDDTLNTDDEAGITLPTQLIRRLGATFLVNASAPGKLDAWIDFNLNGTFDADERVASGLQVAAGSNSLLVPVPEGTTSGTTYARFRISSAGINSPSGTAADGEVEDYALSLVQPATRTAGTYADPQNPGQNVLIISGTSGNDAIVVRKTSATHVTVYIAPNVSIGAFAISSFDRIAVFALAGNDSVAIESPIDKPTVLYGDAGNDSISGGSGPDQIFGGTGLDSLAGNAGDDVITGGVEPDSVSGGAGFDRLIATGSGVFAVTNNSLKIGTVNNLFSTIEKLELTGSTGADSFLFTDFTLQASVDGGSGLNTLGYTGKGNVTLTPTTMVAGAGTTTALITHRNIDNAQLTGDTGANTFDLSTWPYAATLVGGAGTAIDAFVVSGDVNYTLSDVLLLRPSQGMLRLSGFENAILNGGSTNNTFVVSSWNTKATLNGGGGTDQLIAVSNTNFTLTNTSLTRTASNVFTLSSIENAELVGGASNNVLNASSFSGEVKLDGGAGNDTLTSGSGTALLLGGAGNDILRAGAGRALLIGGLGVDNLTGGSNDDLLIDGQTAHDANAIALALLLAEWASANSYADRVAHLTGTAGGLNGSTHLGGSNVLHDTSVDILLGGAGGDLFFAKLTNAAEDLLNDKANSELAF